MIVHHVYFWLKPGCTPAEISTFEQSVGSLKQISSVKMADVGKPAITDRPVIDRSYSYSLLLIFDSLEKHDEYQVDPAHLKFVETCKDLWDRVLIYDSESI